LPDPFDPVLEFQELERAVIVRSYDQSGGASGYTVIAAGTLDRLAAFKVDSSGALLWQRLFDIPNRVSSTFVQRLSTGDAFSYLNQVYVSATVTETRPSVGADMGYAVVYGLSADTGGLFGTATYTTNEDDQSLTSTHLTPDYAPGTTILRGYYLSTNRSRLVTPPQPPYYIPYFETMDPLVIRASLSAAFGGIVWNKRIPGSTGIEGIHTTNVALKVLANRPTAFANVDELSLYTATGNLMTGRSIGMGFADRISFNPGNDMNLISISAFAGSTTELGLVTTFEDGNVAPCGFTSSYSTVDRTVLWSSQLPSQRLVLPYTGSEAVSMELHSATVVDTCP
ncbi:MAG: hypothetical protein KC933_22485, partial [Myxococcales bacterium]|nr:hypothetical protein [Myxococcales bacterium]